MQRGATVAGHMYRHGKMTGSFTPDTRPPCASTRKPLNP